MQLFSLIGWRPSPDGPVLLDDANYKFAWGQSPNTYRISLPQVQNGLLVYRNRQNDPSDFIVMRPDGTDSLVRATIPVSTTNDPIIKSINSLNLYYYSMEQRTKIGESLFGLATPPFEIPTNGKLVYRFNEAGEPWDLTIDFATRLVSGKLPLSFIDVHGPFPPIFYEIESGTFDPVTGKIAGKFTVPEAGREGILHGQFMGPDAGELALAYAGPMFDPDTSAFEQASFLAAGRYCSEC
jgi:hypothetical protein